jgi:hypothetical protein
MSACYSNSRSQLGTFGKLYADHLWGGIGYTDLDVSSAFIDSSLDDLINHKRPIVNMAEYDPLVYDVSNFFVEMGGAVVEESRDNEDVSSNLIFGGFHHTQKVYDINPQLQSEYESLYTDLYFKCLKSAQTSEFRTTLVPLAEALKIRVISKGPADAYFVLHPVQKFLHSTLRKLSTFQLIGKPVTTDILNETFSSDRCHGLTKFLSVDYSSATDLINPELSSLACDTISELINLPLGLRHLFSNSLVGHIVEYDDYSYKNERVVHSEPQRWSQLMGSITSFPILCIINAAICRYAFELGCPNLPFGELSLADLPLLVNGDDGLMPANEKIYSVWKDISRLAGLNPSPGKVYYDASYVNINSTSYTVSTNLFTHIPYVNMGLVKGLGRSSSLPSSIMFKDDFVDKGDLTLGEMHHQLMKSCPLDLIVPLHKLFLDLNSHSLSKTGPIPWYIPSSLGGIGLLPIPKPKKESQPLVEESSRDYSSLEESPEQVSFDLLVQNHRNSSHPLIISDEDEEFLYGPSERDLKCVRIYVNELVSNLGHFDPVCRDFSARKLWWSKWKNVITSRVKLYDTVSPSILKLDEENESTFSYIDTMCYYMAPSQLITEMAVDRSSQFKSNRKIWDRLYRESFKFKNLKSFSSVKPFQVVTLDRFQIKSSPLLARD